MTHDNDILFDETSKNWVLSLFDKGIDKDGFIIEKGSKSRVLTPEGNEIMASELAIISKGSQKFIPSDLTSLMKFSKGEL